MRYALSFLLLLLCSCAGAGIHTGSEIPVSWTLSQADAPDASASAVCQLGEPRPCTLAHSTDERPKFASFMLHVWGPPTTKFTGWVLATYLNDPDPRHYRTDVTATSEGKETHDSFFAKVTSTPGRYSVTVHIEETREGSPPKLHDFAVPVVVN